jgi:hypothetical protein
VAALVPPGQRLLQSQGLAQVYLHDLDGDGLPEAFAVTVPREGTVALEELGRYGRLFEPEGTRARFVLHLFANRASTLSLVRSVDLGTWQVLATLSFRNVSRDLPHPLAVVLVFQTLAGAEHVWVIVPRDPRSEPARSIFHETISKDVSVLDVDGDGALDVVTSDREIEPNGRYETYLTWHRWNGRAFREHASTVVVRNLVQFLARTRTQLLDRAYDDLVRDALEPVAVQGLRRAGLSTLAIIGRFFPSTLDPRNLLDVILPDIRDNPFRIPSEAPASVPLQIRVVDTSGAAHFVQLVLAIARNPFQPRQFSLLPAANPG